LGRNSVSIRAYFTTSVVKKLTNRGGTEPSAGLDVRGKKLRGGKTKKKVKKKTIRLGGVPKGPHKMEKK